MAFVYWIRHKDNSKHFDITQHGYVGITNRTVAQRFKQHVNDSKQNKYPVHRALQKYGDDIEVVTVLEGPIEYCQEIEYKLRPTPSIGYNCAVGGAAPTKDAVFSEETRNKIRAARTGSVASEETKLKMSASQKLRPTATPETRLKISAAHSGKKMSQESKDKVSKANKGRKKPPFTEEHRANMSAALIGRVLSDATKEKLRIANTGKVKSQASKDKFSLAMTGRNLWENSAARKDLWAIADVFSEMVNKFPKKSAKVMVKELGYQNCNPWKLVDKLRTGWNPNEDADWLAFKESYNNKEASIAT